MAEGDEKIREFVEHTDILPDESQQLSQSEKNLSELRHSSRQRTQTEKMLQFHQDEAYKRERKLL